MITNPDVAIRTNNAIEVTIHEMRSLEMSRDFVRTENLRGGVIEFRPFQSFQYICSLSLFIYESRDDHLYHVEEAKII